MILILWNQCLSPAAGLQCPEPREHSTSWVLGLWNAHLCPLVAVVVVLPFVLIELQGQSPELSLLLTEDCNCFLHCDHGTELSIVKDMTCFSKLSLYFTQELGQMEIHSLPSMLYVCQWGGFPHTGAMWWTLTACLRGDHPAEHKMRSAFNLLWVLSKIVSYLRWSLFILYSCTSSIHPLCSCCWWQVSCESAEDMPELCRAHNSQLLMWHHILM